MFRGMNEYNELDLAERDRYMIQIEEQIENSKKMLLDKKKTLHKIAKENQYLEMIQNDYSKYYQYIMQQKRDQIRAIDYLKEYIDMIIVEGNLTDQDLMDARRQREELLVETGKIKQSLDELIEE